MQKDNILDVIWQHSTLTRKLRNKQNNHKSFTVWFTSLPCSGKSTLANAVESILYQEGFKTFIIDGDNIRCGLSSDLGSSEKDRKENIRRTGEVVKLMLEAGIITLVAMISPYVLDNPRRGGDPAMLVASSEKAKKLLNLKFKFQSLESIIKTIL